MNKLLGHFKTICKHKYYVGKYCFKAGIPLRGITHDLSKFSPIEFFEGVKYYQGNRSPIDACKEVNGYSKAWMHHKGRNSHHYEYWIDNLDNGGQPLQMPFKDACELVCDYLGAGHAYMGKNFSYKAEWDWWYTKTSKPLLMHPQTKNFIHRVLYSLMNDELAQTNYKIFNKNSLECYYKEAELYCDRNIH